MDALTDVLQTIELSGVVFLRANLGQQFGLRIPPPTLFHHTIKPASRDHRLAMFHIVREGQGFVEVEGAAEPLRLSEGDLIIVLDEVDHCIVDSPGRETVDSHTLPAMPQTTVAPPAADFGDGDISMRLLCGMLQFVDSGYNPLFTSLPPFIVIRKSDGPSTDWVGGNLTHIVREAESGRPGSQALLSRLTELLFVETLRCYLDTLPDEEQGWLSALRDPLVGQALHLLHAQPGERWTVASLAKRAGASRSALSARFAELLGITPMAYLTRWRMRLAQRLLSGTDGSLGDVCAQVGFESESAFHRAFKKEVGESPAAWRKGHRRLASAAH